MAEVKKKKSKKTNNTSKKANGSRKSSNLKKSTTKASTVKKEQIKKVDFDTTEQITITAEQLNLAFEEKNEEIKEEPIVVKTRSELHQEAKDTKEVKASNNKKGGQLTDIGTFIILIGMLALVIITYITTAYSLSYLITNIFVGASLVVETVGIIFIIISLFKNN